MHSPRSRFTATVFTSLTALFVTATICGIVYVWLLVWAARRSAIHKLAGTRKAWRAQFYTHHVTVEKFTVSLNARYGLVWLLACVTVLCTVVNSNPRPVQFDLKADLSSAFNWNVKQLFVFVSAEYPTKGSDVNQIVVWDLIVKTREEAVLDLTGVNLEYSIVDSKQPDLRGKNITFKLKWDAMPIHGLLQLGQSTAGSATLQVPKA